MSVELPKNIDYSIYNSQSGMSTQYWGPNLWNSLFVSIIGRYPIRIKTNEDIEIKHAFKSMLINLSIIMPCIFCRKSLVHFIQELPIEPYLIGRIELMYWLYQIKNKVNLKLVCQENICYNDEKIRLKKLFYNKQISEIDYYKRIKQFKLETFVTINTPSFKEVLDKYESQRARCDPKAKKCSLPKRK